MTLFLHGLYYKAYKHEMEVNTGVILVKQSSAVVLFNLSIETVAFSPEFSRDVFKKSCFLIVSILFVQM